MTDHSLNQKLYVLDAADCERWEYLPLDGTIYLPLTMPPAWSCGSYRRKAEAPPLQYFHLALARWFNEGRHGVFSRANDIGVDWRIKPRTIRFNDKELPEPLRVAPPDGATGWLVCFDGVVRCEYRDTAVGLTAGRLHLTKSDAQAWVDALGGLMRGGV